MMSPNTGERMLTELDFARLKSLAHGASAPLKEVLVQADVVPSDEVPADVVTMYAKSIVRDLGLQQRRVVTLCYPADADPAQGRISVMSPAGTALLGLRAGDVATWAGPAGAATMVQIETLISQPEALGDYVT